MYTFANTPDYPRSITIVLEDELDRDLLSRIAGLTDTIPRNIADRDNNGKARAYDFLCGLKNAVNG